MGGISNRWQKKYPIEDQNLSWKYGDEKSIVDRFTSRDCTCHSRISFRPGCVYFGTGLL